ncbi:hypothetical protein BDW59DRAFT_176232 [Aspergillus cavernicola]|uniref:Fumarylacetoacetase-like C-terminal domain-containing protein n=1 Tax=Aspergillus cavernicola TaxID=176166 RepID=A0ABR4HIC0_9EURO
MASSQLNYCAYVIEAGESSIVSSREDPLSLSQVKILAAISGRDILAVGKIYVEHAKEFNSSGFDSSDKNDQPSQPVIFTKRATSVIAHGDDVLLHPGFTDTPDYEGEIGVIIGKAGDKISESEAMDHVWGYTIINDFTARERQRDHKQFYIGPSPDTYCPIGPVTVPKERLKENLRVQTFVNGEKRQDATMDQLIFRIPSLVSTLSQGQTIQPGDTIATGTPYGVGSGFRPMKFLKPGDEVKVSVTGLGSLVNRMAPLDAVSPTVERVKSNSNNGLVKVGDKDLFYQFQGQKDGAPVIFIPGLGGSSTYFAPLFDKLSPTHALHLTGLEGHGIPPTNALSSLTIASLAADIRNIYRLANPESKPANPNNPMAVTATRLSLLGQDPEGYAKACMALARSAEETLDVSKLACKTLVITGDQDAVSPPALCQVYGEKIGSVEVKVLEAVAHWHLFEDVPGTPEAVYSFLGVN